MKQEGKLNPEQFCLAMWLINRKQSGRDPPAALTPDMVPPSMRPKVESVSTYVDSSIETPTFYNIPSTKSITSHDIFVM